jgi:hypothetical protein
MLYTRSSFITWLKEVHDCEFLPAGERDRIGVIHIKYGPERAYIMTDSKDRIDYETIQRICQKLYLTRWPDDGELDRLE